MRAYVYAAALYCETCGDALKATLGVSPAEDSDEWPQGPYADGGGEADTPSHCDCCGVFLENPLTPEGRAYVVDALKRWIASGLTDGNAATLKAWAGFYGITVADMVAGALPRPGFRVFTFDEDGPHELGTLDPEGLHELLRGCE